jgi:hypothetical protein
MPSDGGGGGDKDGSWRHVGGGGPERVEGPGAITADERDTSQKNRRGQTQWNKNCQCEPTDRKEIMGDVWGYENVVEIERPRENRCTY